MRISAAIRLLRPRQWVKNIFVVLPLFFSGQLFDWILWPPALLAAMAFSFAASAVYCLNDIIDRKADRLHPVKSSRPIASGDVKVSAGWVVMWICLLLSAGFCALIPGIADNIFPENSQNYTIGIETGLTIGLYVALNVAYCLYIKRVAIADVFTLACGFVLRLIAGAVACRIWLSPWIVCLTFLLALFLAFAKRRDDVLMNERGELVTRQSTLAYNRTFLDQTLGVVCAVTLVCYIMYCLSPEVIRRLGSDYVYITSVFVLFGMLRYLQLTIVVGRSGSPTEIVLGDRMIRWTLAGWILCFGIILYF